MAGLLGEVPGIEVATKLDSSNARGFIAKNDRIGIIIAWSNTCSDCYGLWQITFPLFMAEHRNDYNVGHVEMHEQPRFFEAIGIQKLPTILFCYDNQIISRISGLLVPEQLEAALRLVHSRLVQKEELRQEALADKDEAPDSSLSLVRRLLDQSGHRGKVGKVVATHH